MRKSFAARVLFSCALLCASSAWAWNATGHEAVADIAWDNLTPETKAKVTELLKQHPDYTRALTRETTAADVRDREAFMIAATWPDLIRSTSFGKSHDLAHSNWHYADTPYVLGNVKPPAEPNMNWPAGKEPENAVQALKKTATDLRNTTLPPSERAIALCWIEHLVGDIHQPLHAVSLYSPEYPQGDRGGNLMLVRLPSSDGNTGRTLNLHSYWDGLLGGVIEIENVEKIATALEKQHPRSEFQKELAVKDVDQWAHTSFELAKQYAYNGGKLPGVPGSGRDRGGDSSQPSAPPLSADYIKNAHTVAERNVALAGYRLADVLNNALSSNP